MRGVTRGGGRGGEDTRKGLLESVCVCYEGMMAVVFVCKWVFCVSVRFVWCGVVWCGVEWCGVVLCGVVWVKMVHPLPAMRAIAPNQHPRAEYSEVLRYPSVTADQKG